MQNKLEPRAKIGDVVIMNYYNKLYQGKLPHYCKHGVQINNGYACNFCKKEEKKECEHKVEDVSTNIGFETNFGRIPLFLCKCGLVTCKNPNE